MTAVNLPPDVVEYLAIRDRQRAEAVQRTLDALTPREQRLIREVAAMAYVHGSRAAQAGERNIPPDAAIVSVVVDACLGMPDLYPTLNRAARNAARKASSDASGETP